MLPGFCSFVRSFFLAPEYHYYTTFGIELDDHVRPFVHRPEIIVLIESDGVGEGPGVEVVADLANEFPIRGELENLRGAGAIGWPGGVAAREHEDVFLRVD